MIDDLNPYGAFGQAMPDTAASGFGRRLEGFATLDMGGQ